MNDGSRESFRKKELVSLFSIFHPQIPRTLFYKATSASQRKEETSFWERERDRRIVVTLPHDTEGSIPSLSFNKHHHKNEIQSQSNSMPILF